MKRFWNSLNIAFSMYSRLPAAQCDWSEENTKYVMCFFPWIGVVIGALCLGWDALAGWLAVAAPLRSAVLVLIPVFVSGGIHLDGLLDTADALGSWRSREKRLEILRDSHAGAFAVVVCAAYFLLSYAVLDAVRGEMLQAYAFSFAVSRSLSGFSVVTFPKATAEGTVAGFSRSAQTRVIQAVCLSYVALCAVGMALLQPLYAVAALGSAGITFFWYYRMAMKQFGGINGDLAGCFLSVCELAMPLGMAVAGAIAQRIA